MATSIRRPPETTDVLTEAIARATEILERVEARRTEILDRRREAIEETLRVAALPEFQQAVTDPALRQRADAMRERASEELTRVDAARKQTAESFKAARSALALQKKRRRVISVG
jgi:hypothetical protein